MQIYEMILQMQAASISSPHFFGYKIRPQYAAATSLGYDHPEYTYKLYLYIVNTVGQGLTRTSAALAQDPDDDSIANAITIDFADFCSKVDLRTMRAGAKPLIDVGIIQKMGYHGHRYVVNPFVYNRLTPKECRYVQRQLRQAMKQQP